MKRPAFALLAGCLANDLAPTDLDALAARLSPADWAELPDLAAHHDIHLLAGTVLRDVDAVPLEVRSHFSAQAPARRARQMRGMADLTQLVHMVAGMPWVLLKGPVLAEHVWRRRGLREYGDLDVLVRPDAVPDLLMALEASGAELRTRNWKFVHDGGWSEMSLRLWRGSTVDLHWSLLGHSRGLPEQTFNTQDILDRRRPILLENAGNAVPVFAPDAADMLLHVAVHTLPHAMSLLRHVADLDQLLRHDPPSPEVFVARARSQGLGLIIATVLQRSLRFRTRAELDEVIRELAPRSPWLRLMTLNDALNQENRVDRRFSMKLIVAATRSSTRSSVSTLAAMATHELGRRIVRARPDELPAWSIPIDDGYRDRVLTRLVT